ncbi:ATP-binding protein [bacterium]|nr:ATP-binding protein [bacterium]
MDAALSKLLLKLPQRAEKVKHKALIDSFVDVEPLLNVLERESDQILYGRRGTGKTHVLKYLMTHITDNNDITLYVDLRTIGSTGGLYSDTNQPLSQRSTRLLLDIMSYVHDEIRNILFKGDTDLDYKNITKSLDDFASSITEIEVVGTFKSEITTKEHDSSSAAVKADLSTSKGLSAGLSTGSSSASEEEIKETREGTYDYHLHLGRLYKSLQHIINTIPNNKLWILLDEWSSIPVDLQPYVADLLRRAVLPVEGIFVKIAAIEKRTKFAIKTSPSSYVGFELGSDISADLSMDDFMVFDNDEQKARKFFIKLIHKHVLSIATSDGERFDYDEEALIKNIFTQENVFMEFVRASEGIPRDSFNILSEAVIKNYGKIVNMQSLRKASKTWYERDKEPAVGANETALNLLHWIVAEVIAHRQARAFLLPSKATHPLIDELFDARVLHLLKKNISSHDQPGSRYDVYKIDYGCYIDLMSTRRAPLGFLYKEDKNRVSVPVDDYRAIRRAILEMDKFFESERQQRLC